MKNILIIGSTSAIAESFAKIQAQQGHSIFLIGRDLERLQKQSEDLKIRGAKYVASTTFNAENVSNYTQIINDSFSRLKTFDTVLIAHGTLPNQEHCEQDLTAQLKEIHINAISTVALLSIISAKMEQQGFGTIAAITSVAGDRGRQSNYIYGSCKKMISTYLQGLRNRLCRSNINVIDIKPGFVDTPMTREFEKSALWSTPPHIAKIIDRSINKNKHTIYAPSFWRYIMWVIKCIPERVFIRLTL